MTVWINGTAAREQLRMIFITVLAPILGFYSPLGNFLLALTCMFAFNIWCGMRADGVSIVRCRNFSMKKFKQSLMEVILYLVIMVLVYTVMTFMGDRKASIVVVKSLSYVFMYIYLQNAFRNLIIAYPTRTAFHMIYHIVRLEFKRALPEHIKEVVERYEKENPDGFRFEGDRCTEGKENKDIVTEKK